MGIWEFNGGVQFPCSISNVFVENFRAHFLRVASGNTEDESFLSVRHGLVGFEGNLQAKSIVSDVSFFGALRKPWRVKAKGAKF